MTQEEPRMTGAKQPTRFPTYHGSEQITGEYNITTTGHCYRIRNLRMLRTTQDWFLDMVEMVTGMATGLLEERSCCFCFLLVVSCFIFVHIIQIFALPFVFLVDLAIITPIALLLDAVGVINVKEERKLRSSLHVCASTTVT
jgi:hypothetical protein